jgi:hypothetical protein
MRPRLPEVSIGRLLHLALLALLLCWRPAAAQPADPADDAFWYDTAADGGPAVVLHFFWTASCPHCKAAQPFVESLPRRLPWVRVASHPLTGNRPNAELYVRAARLFGQEANAVPGFMFCRRLETGFEAQDTTGAELIAALEACRAERTGTASGGAGAAGEVRLPLVGTVDLQRWSLPVLTVVLAGLDAFNPCAFFVLLFLLSLLVHARSRARMALVGGVFVLFSGLVYFAFMAAWLNAFLLAGELRAVTVAAGLLALIVGAMNLKDYFLFGRGPSLSIPESAKPQLFRRMREVVNARSLGTMLAGAVLLAIAANSYELLCTAGLPMVYTRALTLHGLDAGGHYAWLALYNAIYVLPLAAIVAVFAWTMGARRLSEREGRVLKLVSGYMMLGLGALLLVAPQMLTSAASSLAVLPAALLASLATLKLSRR